MTQPRLLVLGLGNVLCTDDGVGPAAVARLCRHWEAPEGTEVVDGGTLGLALMALLDAASAVILVDAVAVDGAPAGTLVRLEGDEVPSAIVHRLSPHQIGVADLLDGLWLLDRTPPRLILLGLVPASLDLGVEPTSAVAAAIPGLVEEIAREAAALGHPFRRRISHEVPDLTNDLGVFHGLDL